ncbi:MAG: formate dehydrogenase accessory protein FdhE [Firmicutes bacterium]|nr:formate dehydrogenase accessory protein FdhE [Bacillota bacterium]
MTELKQHEDTLDSEMLALQEAYQKLQAIIVQWQRERGEYWVEGIVPNTSLPYFLPESLPVKVVLEVMGRLLEGKVHHESAEDLRSLWNRFLLGQNIENVELLSLFNLALNGILELARKQLPADLRQAAENEEVHLCPICGQEPGLALLTPPNGKRYLHCTRCGHDWPSKRIGCIHCGSEEASEQTYLKNENFPGIEIIVCQACGGDIKELDLRIRTVEDFVWEDIRTLPLNYAAEKWLNEEAQKKEALH